MASEAELDELPEASDMDSSLLSAAMDSVLSNNDVQWCDGTERGRDFRDRYLDAHNAYERQTYSTKEEYLKSIEDYVDCGDGYI